MTRRIIDLTFPIHEGMLTFPVHWHPTVEITQLGFHEKENRETRKIVFGTHTGTHCDAPSHFIPGDRSIDQVDLDVFIGPALVVDFSHAEPLQEMQVEDLEREFQEERPSRVIFRYDWSENWGKDRYYSHNPFLSEDAASWLVDRGVKLVAMDTPMPDNPKHGMGCDIDSPIHKILLGNGVVLTEYLTNLRSIKKREVELIVMPLKIENGDGSPARVVCIESD